MLAEQVVGDAGAVGGVDRVTGREALQAAVGALAHGLGADAEQAREILVRAVLLEDELHDGALIWGEGIQAHEGGSVVVAGSTVAAMAAEESLHNQPLMGFDALYGLQLDAADGDEVRGHVVIDDRHLQPRGLVHGGLYAAIAESLASLGTAVGTGMEKFVAGLSNHASFLRPVFAGDTITAVGAPRHRGRTTWVWEIEISDGEGRTCALVRVTIAVRELPTDPPSVA